MFCMSMLLRKLNTGNLALKRRNGVLSESRKSSDICIFNTSVHSLNLTIMSYATMS